MKKPSLWRQTRMRISFRHHKKKLEKARSSEAYFDWVENAIKLNDLILDYLIDNQHYREYVMEQCIYDYNTRFNNYTDQLDEVSGMIKTVKHYAQLTSGDYHALPREIIVNARRYFSKDGYFLYYSDFMMLGGCLRGFQELLDRTRSQWVQNGEWSEQMHIRGRDIRKIFERLIAAVAVMNSLMNVVLYPQSLTELGVNYG